MTSAPRPLPNPFVGASLPMVPAGRACGTYTWHMAQVTIDLPADVLEAARKCTGQENRSLSAWVSGLILEATATATEWPRRLVNLLHHGSGDLVEPDDPPPEDVDAIR